MTIYTGRDALLCAELCPSIVLQKYADPTEGYRLLSLDEAEEVLRQDPSLVYCVVSS